MNSTVNHLVNRRLFNRFAKIRLLTGAASVLAIFHPSVGYAQEVEETASYTMQVLTQSFDGEQESSKAQALAYARMRRGDESWIELDFGDGGAVIENRGGTAAGLFTNTSGVEAGLRYNYATRRISGGDPLVERFHNTFVRRKLGRGPALGSNAQWSVQLRPAELGVVATSGAPLTIELSRKYFSHGGHDYVLLHYRVPAFSYDALGRQVVQWGEGAALTDPGFGMMYWNVALHRAVGEQEGTSGRPYRQMKTMIAIGRNGKPMIDPRSIPQTAALLDSLQGQSAQEIIGFIDGTMPDHTPLIMANAIDIMALSIAEDSPNQLGEVTSQIANSVNGLTETAPPPANTQPNDNNDNLPVSVPNPISTQGGGALDTAMNVSGTLNTSVDLADKFSAITEGLNVLVSQSASLSGQLGTLEAQITAITNAIAAEPPLFRASTAFSALKVTYEAQKAELASLEAVFDTGIRTGVLPPPGMVSNYIRLTGESMDSATELSRMAAAGESLTVIETARDVAMATNLQSKAAELGRVQQALATLGTKAGGLQPLIKSLSQTEFASLVKSFGSSPYAKVLSGVATGLNVSAVGMAAYNTTTAAGTDLATGQDLPLTRNYGTGGSATLVGLEIMAMAGNAYSGNVKGLFYDMAAISVGSVTDIIISMKGVQDANFRAVEAEMDYYTTELMGIRRRASAFEQQLADLGAEVEGVREDLANFDRDTDAAAAMAQQLLDERRRNRAEREAAEATARQAEENELRRIAQEAAQRAAEEEARRTEPNEEEWAQFHEDITAAMQPDYPTLSQDARDRISEEAQLRREAEREAELALEAEQAAQLAGDIARALAEREQQQREMQRISDEAVAQREQERLAREQWLEEARDRELTVADLTVSQLNVSEFDIKPVTFEGPEWDPPVFHPPEWVPPEFHPPKITPIDWSNFDDDDYPATGNLAFDYLDMAGTVETDLSRWAEWLATQNVRELERLALQAGYPNLASALADAENIIHQSQDEGYRQWALQAPSCGGYVGCGPSYLERWAMKTSIVALGDILVQSRGIFSSGGFSDIGITGLNLSYLLRDHGVEDGDIVQIMIQQFGRTIYEGSLSLTNAGDTFNLQLRPGVASLTIYAVNEGQLRPNTAQIKVDKVVRGEATQTYNLNTGETAVLRIETNTSSGGK